MAGAKEKHYCKNCQEKTMHYVVSVRNKEDDGLSERKRFWKGFIIGWTGILDGIDRHLICEKCGNKFIDQ